MVRKYKRKTEARDEGNLRRALQAIDLGMSTRAAARQFNVSQSSLNRHRLNNERNRATTTAETVNASSAIATITTSATSTVTSTVTTAASSNEPVPSTSMQAVSSVSTENNTQLLPSDQNFIIHKQGGRTVRI